MKYQDAINFIKAAEGLGCTPGLSRVTELLRRLGNPQDRVPCIHIAGTNGKGSTAAMTAAILQAAGYRTGLYTSPHLMRYNERICINGAEIPDDAFCRMAERVSTAAEGMVETPSEFERFTPMAYLYFCEEACDIAVIETGLGGRLDATNVIAHPEMDVITHIALDHTEYLGDTLAAIAAEKAGIIKAGADVILTHQDDVVEAVIRTVCAGVHAENRLCVTEPQLFASGSCTIDGQQFSYRQRENLFLGLPGLYQRDNVMTALDAIDALRRRGWQIPEEAVRTGLAGVCWPGRFEVLRRDPLVILDGAHNENGVRALAGTLQELLPDRRVILVLGVLADKQYDVMLRLLLPRAKCIIASEPDNARALPAEKLYREILRLADEMDGALDDSTHAASVHAGGSVCDIPVYRDREHGGMAVREDKASREHFVHLGGATRDSLRLACELAAEEDVICVAGSLYQAGAVREFFSSRENPPALH